MARATNAPEQQNNRAPQKIARDAADQYFDALASEIRSTRRRAMWT
jgi:hypothetical protein